MAEAYREAVPNVSVYALKCEDVKSVEEENRELRQKLLERQEERMKKTEEKRNEIMRCLKNP